MPYYVFAVKPFGQLDKLADFEVFKEASAHAKALRAEQPSESPVRIKVMFAENQLGAEESAEPVAHAQPDGRRRVSAMDEAPPAPAASCCDTTDSTTFLFNLHQKGELELDFRPLNAAIGYHLPCHQRGAGPPNSSH